MKLFTVGPVQMDNETLKASGMQIPYFRTEEFSEILFECDHILKRIIFTEQNTKSIYLTASGTAAMEAVIINIFTPKDKVLIINGGTFGQRFLQLCHIHDITYETIDLPFGAELTSDSLKPFEDENFTGMLVNIHESSTGQLYDIKILSEFCKKNNLFLIVDAISSFLVDEFKMDPFGADAVIISSQKALGLAPGISIILLSETLYKKRILHNKPKTLYFRFTDYIRDMERGQTPYTPSVGIILQLYEKLKRIDETGIESMIEYSNSLAKRFRCQLPSTNLLLPNYPLSNGLTPVVCPKQNAKEIFKTLKRDYNIYVTPNGGELSNDLFRVGHMGNLKLEDMDLLIKCLKHSCNQ